MSFSIPDDVAETFNKAFEAENKDAVMARLMRKAVEERERSRRSGDFVERVSRISDRTRGRRGGDRGARRARE